MWLRLKKLIIINPIVYDTAFSSGKRPYILYIRIIRVCVTRGVFFEILYNVCDQFEKIEVGNFENSVAK